MANYPPRKYRKPSSPAALFVLAAICLIGGPAIGYSGYAQAEDAKSLQKTGKTVKGFVIGSYKKTGSKSTTTELTVEFFTEDGKRMSGKKSVASAVYNRYYVEHDGDDAKMCDVTYEPAKPEGWKLADQIGEDIASGEIMMFVGPGVGLLLAAILFFSGMNARKRRAAEKAMMAGYAQGYPQAPQPYPQAPQPYPQAPQQYPQAGYPPQSQGYPPQQQPAPYQPYPQRPQTPYQPPQPPR